MTSLSNDMARKYASRIRRHAASVACRLPRHVGMEDLVSAGYAGLVDAFVRLDPTRMDSFESYIDRRIRGAILDELRKHDPLTRHQRAFARRLAATVHQLSASLGCYPDETETAAALGLTLTAFQTQRSRTHEMAACTGACVYGEAFSRPDTLAECRERHSIVCAAMERLSPRQRHVLRMYYDEEQTTRQIADKLGVSDSRVSQIHSESIQRLRGLVADC